MKENDRDMPLISVIVTTRNEEDAIRNCLKSVRNQTYKPVEIIVVDNASDDRTLNIARQFTNLVFDKGPERSAQRNYGAKQAKGTYLLFLDADMVISPTTVEECVVAINKNNVRACIVPETSTGSGFWTKCKILERTYYEGVVWMEAARFYDKKTFVLLEGFDEELTGPEDFDLSQRVAAQYGQKSISRITSYIYHDEGVIRLTELLRKKYYYGRQMHRYVSKNDNRLVSRLQANPWKRYTLFFRKPNSLLYDPIHAIGMMFMKTLELGALALGMITSYI